MIGTDFTQMQEESGWYGANSYDNRSRTSNWGHYNKRGCNAEPDYCTRRFDKLQVKRNPFGCL